MNPEQLQPEAHRVGILITGNEVLFGKTKDTNGPFLAAHFRKIGIAVEQIVICGDERRQLLSSLSFLSERCTTILMTGGLGPTSDDLTAALVAEFLNVPTVFVPEAWDACVKAFERLGRKEVPESNKKQAMLPFRSAIIANPVGTAVGFSVQGKANIMCLPGVPFELEPMFLQSVLPQFISANQEYFSRSWQVFYMGESAMQMRLADLETLTKQQFPEAVLSYQAHAGSVTYSLTYSPLPLAFEDKFKQFFAEVFEPSLLKALQHHVIAIGEDALHTFVVKGFSKLKLKLSLAESCTGGALSQKICEVPGASAMFPGGIVTYSNAAKHLQLAVSLSALEKFGAVSATVAAQMALGAQNAFNADLALSITGIAGPNGGTDAKPVGTVYLALHFSAMALASGIDPQKLQPFGWFDLNADQDWILTEGLAKMEPVNLGSTVVARLKLGSRFSRSVVQMRTCQFALGSLAALLPNQLTHSSD